MAASDKTKKWLEEISRAIEVKERLKNRIHDINEKHDSLCDPSQGAYGHDVNSGIKTHRKSDRTGAAAIDICDNLPQTINKLEAQLLQVQEEIDAARDILDTCLCNPSSDMKVQEYDTILYMYFEEKSIQEIEEILHYSETSVRKFHKEGIKKLHDYREKVRKKAELCGKKRNCAE